MNRERRRIVDSVLDSGVGHSQAVSSLERLSDMYMPQLNREQREIMTRNIREAIDTINRSRQTTVGSSLTSGVVRNQVLRNIAQRTNENRAQQERLARQRSITGEILSNVARRVRRNPFVVSPTLQGLPFPLRPQSQGGALIPSREPSLENLPTVAERVVGRPRDILTRITGIASNRETLNMIRSRVNRLGQDFGFDASALITELFSRGDVLNRARTKLNANGRRMLGELLIDVADDLGIPIEKFYSQQ
jgi:hypothetical protein